MAAPTFAISRKALPGQFTNFNDCAEPQYTFRLTMHNRAGSR